jgi:hypothetical protein
MLEDDIFDKEKDQIEFQPPQPWRKWAPRADFRPDTIKVIFDNGVIWLKARRKIAWWKQLLGCEGGLEVVESWGF